MAKLNYTRLICDRCGTETTIDSSYHGNEKTWSWGKLWFAENNGPIWIRSKTLPKYQDDCADICPDCLNQLNAWFYFRDKDVDKTDES